MSKLTDLLKKIPGPVLALVAAVSVWLAMGQMGYRAGARVYGVGGTQLDPEFVRLIASIIAAAFAGGLAKLPYVDSVRAILVQLGLTGALTPDEQRDQYERVKWLSRDKPVDPPVS